VLPGRNNVPGYLGAFVTALLGLLGTVIALRERNRQRGEVPEAREEGQQ